MSTPSNSFANDWPKRVGIVVTTLIFSISGLAVVGLLSYIAVNIYKRPRRLRPLAMFFIMLLCFELFVSIGNVMSGRWADLGVVVEDGYCVAQGALQSFGEVGVATSTMIITWATLFKIIFVEEDFSAMREVVWLSSGLCALNVLFVILVATIPIARYGRKYYGDTGIWCWISEDFQYERNALEYHWFWATAACGMFVHVAALLHALGPLVGRAKLTGVWVGLRFHRDGNVLRFIVFERRVAGQNHQSNGFQLWTQNTRQESIVFLAIVWDDALPTPTIDINDTAAVLAERARRLRMRQARKEALLMLLYPLAYIVVILPQSIIRERQFHGHPTTTRASIVGISIFGCSGLFNVLLYMTGRFKFDLGPIREPEDPPRDDEESHHSSIGDNEPMDQINEVSGVSFRYRDQDNSGGEASK